MCLTITETTKRQKAIEDIVCYKLVEGMSINDIHSFYQEMPVNIGNVYTSSLLRDPEELNEIKKGFHSFKSLLDLKKEVEEYWPNYMFHNFKIFVVECIIPKNSYYYEGIFDDFSSFASTKIKYVKIVKTQKQ